MKTYAKSWLALTALVVAALTAFILASRPARAAVPWYVAPGGSDGNSCLSPGAACATINGAIGKAFSGDTVYVARGTYTNSTGSEVVLIDKSIILSGGWDAGFTTQSGMSMIDGQGSRRGITVNSGVMTSVARFIIQHGEISGGDGDGVRNDGTLTLDRVHIRNNAKGGGIYNTGTLTLNNSAVTDNSTTPEGGRGGIFNAGGSLTLNNSTVSGNATCSPAYCAFIGGISNSGGSLTLNNTSVVNNVNGGLWSYPASSATLQNSIIAGNRLSDGTLKDCEGQLNSLGYNLIGVVGSSCTLTSATGDQAGSPSAPIDPKLGPLTASPAYHPLLGGSPAINAGNPAGCLGSAGLLTTDQRGAPRVGICDIGAYEYTIPGPAASLYASGGTPQRTPPRTTFETPLQAVVLDSLGTPVSNTMVTFSAPASGASGTFTGTGAFTATAVADENGFVTAPVFMANALPGSYMVTATASGVITLANFLLNNFGWYVALGGNDSNDCQSSSMPCATVGGVLGKGGFMNGDGVLVARGTYTGTGDQVVRLNKSVRLLGGWNETFAAQSDVSTIDGENTRTGIFVDKRVAAIIERFVVRNGSSGSAGGGIFNGGALILNNSIISGNTAQFGGGIANGGRSSDYVGTVLTLNNTVVSNNTASYLGHGGGIYNIGTLTLNNSTVTGNMAPEGGGGIRGFTSISSYPGTLSLNNSTVTNNSASYGGGIFVDHYDTWTLKNSILAGNTAAAAGPDCSGTIGSSGYNLVENTSGCTFNAATGDLLNVDAKLGPLQDNGGPTLTHALLPGSPAIDAGNPAGCADNLGNLLAFDQRGAPRVGRCDIGAYEVSPFATKSVSGIFSPGGLVTYTITLGPNANRPSVSLTDTLPSELTYVPNSLSVTNGAGVASQGVITWTGTVSSNSATVITFSATISNTAQNTVIVNTAASTWGRFMVLASAIFDTFPYHLYLPSISR